MTDTEENASILEFLKSLTLLCVEDNKTTQLIYEIIFEDLVKNIIFADNGAEGYEEFLKQDIDIIISDYDMPTLNGLEMIHKIRDIDKTIPIILVSAIEDVTIITKALRLNVNNFIKKPIINKEVMETILNTSKLLIADRFLQEQRDKKLHDLQQKEKYNSYQEDLAFAKELNILRNDFYYQMITSDGISLVDFLYQPLDVVSGDAYSARRIDEHSTFYLMVDGMGKGLSASLTAMIMTSFVNHIFDKMLFLESFDLGILINETMKYIQPILLDEEALAIDYVVVNYEENMLYYSKFAMPVLLMEDNSGEIVRLKSNNPPLCKWQPTFNVAGYDISNISKFLIYSDGIVENETIHEGKPYSDFIEKDFLDSFTRENLKDKFFEKIDEAEDDITLIFINRLPLHNLPSNERIFETSLEDIDCASEWYDNLWQDFTSDTKAIYNASLVFTELYMNAYEHGNLKIDSATKNRLLNDDIYFETLKEQEKTCSKTITVKVTKVTHHSTNYIITQISDEGEGFDTQILSQIFRNSATFNGRGVFVSRKNSLGIYYNSKGNTVLYLNKLENI